MAVHYSSTTPEWQTPAAIIARVVEVLGAIDLDPCAEGERLIPAKAHFTREKDGLSRYWYGRIYMNPPYGREIEQWLKHLCREYGSGRTTEAIALVPAQNGYALDAESQRVPEGVYQGTSTLRSEWRRQRSLPVRSYLLRHWYGAIP